MSKNINEDAPADRVPWPASKTALPAIHMTGRDRDRLESMLSSRAKEISASVRDLLKRKLQVATIFAPDEIPGDVVTMNSRILFRRHVGHLVESRTLVYSDEYTLARDSVSVFTPLGAALLGLRAGSSMPYDWPDGVRWIACVDAVAYQPEAQGRHVDQPYRRWPRAGTDDGAAKRTVVPLRPAPKPRPKMTDDDDDPGPQAA